jgi:hypothetical protein
MMINTTKGLTDVIHTRHNFYPWLIFLSSSGSADEEQIPGAIFIFESTFSLEQIFPRSEVEHLYGDNG